jgi:DNA-binding Lrp family transcriptional regulator
MAKISYNKIKNDEKKLIYEFQTNARDNLEALAKRCGFSRQKALRIIKKLEKEKKIWGYSAIIDNEKFNLKRYIILIRRSTEPIDDAISKIIELTLQRKGKKIDVFIEYSSYIFGRYDWMLIITAKDIASVKKFSNILEKEYVNVISEVHILEELFPVTRNGISNPNMEKLKDFI